MPVTYLNSVIEGFVGFGEFTVGPGKSLNLDFVFADLTLVLLLQAGDLTLVAGLDLNDGALKLIKSSLASLAVNGLTNGQGKNFWCQLYHLTITIEYRKQKMITFDKIIILTCQ